MDGFLFLILYVGILSLPGIAIQRALRLELNPFLASVGLSYGLFALIFISANHLTLSASIFIYLQATILVYSVIYITLGGFRSPIALKKVAKGTLNPIIIITVVSAIYQIVFGSFNEIPADLYTHMERYQLALGKIANDSLGRALSWKALLFQKSGVFYYLLASVAGATNASAETVVAMTDFANRTLFLIAIYFFSSSVFDKQDRLSLVAFMTVIFTALHMGINVFAYIRYYTLAPSMLSMVVYMAAIALFISVSSQELKPNSLISYSIIIALSCAAASIHVQEAMFIGIIIALISTLAVASKARLIPFEFKTDFRQALPIFTLAIVVFAGIYIYSQSNLPRATNSHWRLWEFGAGSGLLPDITTLNLKFQFSRVLTLWGMFVYLLFFFHIKRYRSNPFILAAMFSPLATFLNPFFVDVFLRYDNSTTLWRLCYLIPVHFVAADLFVHYARELRTCGLLKRSINAILIFTLIALLLPIKNTWQGVHYSRFPTLAPTAEKLGYRHYHDLLEFLESIEQPHKVLTDPITGYMVTAMTKHSNSRKKFFRDNSFKYFNFKSYSDRPLINKYPGHLLITNNTAHPQSKVGKLAGHWSPYEWHNKKHYYGKALIEHLTAHPSDFELLWSGVDIKVYRIRDSY
jgi:hypothetical protein